MGANDSKLPYACNNAASAVSHLAAFNFPTLSQILFSFGVPHDVDEVGKPI